MVLVKRYLLKLLKNSKKLLVIQSRVYTTVPNCDQYVGSSAKWTKYGLKNRRDRGVRTYIWGLNIMSYQHASIVGKYKLDNKYWAMTL